MQGLEATLKRSKLEAKVFFMPPKPLQLIRTDWRGDRIVVLVDFIEPKAEHGHHWNSKPQPYG